MLRKTLDELGDRQRAVVEILWRRNGASVREVRHELSPDGRLAYTTILSTLQKLEAAGWLRHERPGRRHVYRVIPGRAEAVREATRRFVERLYRGDPAALALEVLEAAAAASGPRPTLRRLVDFRRGVA